MPERWGRLVREAREVAGISQTELADRVGVHPSVISKMEKGGVFITPEVYQKLCLNLRSLNPVDLLNALGYPVGVTGADRLPRQLVQDLLLLSPRRLQALAELLHQEVGTTPPEQASVPR